MPRRSLVAVVCLLLAAACDGSSADVTVTSEPGATSTTTTSPPADIPSDDQVGVTEGPTITWERIDAPEVFEGGILSSVVEAGPGLVAVGTDELTEDAAVWISEDGMTWERIESDSFSGEEDDNGLDGGQSMADIAVGPNGIVAVGDYERRAERDVDAGVWLSQDGLTWERIEDDTFELTGTDSMNSVTVWNGSYVAGGQVAGPVGSGESRPAIWISENGREWEMAEGSSFRIDASIINVTRRGSRLYAVGSSGHVARPTLWFSDDGAAWDVVHSDQSSDGLIGSIGTDVVEDLSDMFMIDAAITPDGFVAVGGRGEPRQAVFWRSSDGMFWEVSAITPDPDRPIAPVFMSSIINTPRGVVAVGGSPLDTTLFPPISFAQVWASADNGWSWYQIERTSSSMAVEGPSSPWHIGTMTDVIGFGDGLLAVGFVPYQGVTLPGPFYHQAVWLGEWTATP